MDQLRQKSGWHVVFPDKLLLCLWICFIVRGCFYSALLPLWEGYDEPFHFSFVQYVAAHNELPVVTTPVSREVQASLHLLPLSWEQRLHGMALPIYTEDSYWQLPERTRHEMQERICSIPREWGTQLGTAPAMYEAQQAPLYYWIMSAPLRLSWQWTLPARVMLVRILSILLTSLLIPVAYVTAKRFFNSREQGLGIVALITCMPELMIDVSRVANESLAVVMFSLLTLLLLLAVQPEQSRWFLPAGMALGIGLLSKAYFVLAIPAFLFVGLYSAWHCEGQRKRILLNSAVGFCLAAIMSFGWYWRNHSLTGSWSGEVNDVVAVRGGLARLFGAVTHVHWIGGVTSVLVSHVWFGAWSFLKLPKPVYLVFALGMAAAVLGLAMGLVKDRFRSSQLFVLFTVYVFFWLGLLYDMLITYISTGSSSSTGWYMYAVILPEVLLVACAFYSLVPRRWQWAVLPAIAAAFAAIDLYGVHTLLAPYYTGLIAHADGTDVLHPMSLAQLARIGPSLILDRLRVNKPAFLEPGVVAIVALLYYAATALAVAIGYRAMTSIRPGFQGTHTLGRLPEVTSVT